MHAVLAWRWLVVHVVLVVLVVVLVVQVVLVALVWLKASFTADEHFPKAPDAAQ